MNASPHPHVLIVGGGPAGLAAAIRLRRHGLPVTVCDAGRPGTTPIGERVSGRFRELLPALDIDPALVAACIRRSPGIVSSWGSPVPHLADGCLDPYGVAWHLDRPAFEDLLRRQAARLGAEVLTDTRVIQARVAHARGWTVTLRSGGKRQMPRISTREASVIVDAAGRTGRDPLGRVRLAKAQDVLVATAFVFERNLRAPSCDWTLVEAVASGWWYSAPLPDNRSTVIFFSDRDGPRPDVTEAGTLAALTDAQLTLDRLPHGHAIEECRRVAVVIGAAPRSDHRLYVPIGDAALAVDPLSGTGLSIALETAVMAADAIVAAAQGKSETIDQYRNQVDTIFASHLAARTRVYAAETRWADRLFWRRRSTPPISSSDVAMQPHHRAL